MKILVLSDLHSNINSLKAIWEREKDYDAVYCAGDLVDYGIRPRETLDFVREKGFLAVQGNHDAHTVNIFREGRFNMMPDAQYKWVHHNCQRMTAEDIDFLAGLPRHRSFMADGVAYLMQHQYDETYGTINRWTHLSAFGICMLHPSIGTAPASV